LIGRCRATAVQEIFGSKTGIAFCAPRGAV